MDRLAGALQTDGGRHTLLWAENSAPIRNEATGAEAIVLGPAAKRANDIAHELTRAPGATAKALDNLHRAAGGFAFALWESAEGRLTLGTDSLGLQAIYYRGSGDEIEFGARLTDLSPPDERKKLQLASLNHFLIYLSLPPGKTLLGGVRRTPPGVSLRFPDEGDPHCLYPIETEPVSSEVATSAKLLDILKTSINRALSGIPDDEPAGILLSGGIDSTALLALAKQIRGDAPIIAIHASPEGNPDREYARRMAEKYGAEFLDIKLGADDAAKSLAWIVSSMEAPGGNASAVANCRAFAMARERGVGRIISGLGSDEIFCGQGKHLLAPWWPWLARLPRPIRGLASMLAPTEKKEALRRALEEDNAAEMHRSLYAFFSNEESAAIKSGLAQMAKVNPYSWREPLGTGFPPVYSSELLQVDLNTWLRSSLTPMAGTLSAANGIELLLPFCSPEAVNLSASLPLSWKVRGREGKRLLRRTLSGIIPQEIFERPQQGFTVPMSQWLRGDLAPLARELLSPEKVEPWNIIAPGALAHMLNEHESEKRDRSLPLWAWMTFSIWYERFAG
ncbi:MAG: hypothetical protein HOC91_03970 [Nitrospinaceae bacterium]|jgi:asparagine synthase (glutamine-hydrolysing)|nr:hypothetical protein [Nitrospinaceae bacterium]MBT4429650.1 hypothetical protein [Nitrospinaceae bacterium]MBT5369990.1 hypothetical protein [Nitrospinaceae bacterium]MBT5946561.1 hypothetical protein [Nitrospinaceae bacterium]MBT6393913.1 hypothetical protein [Nitrospinaceae bacterium]